MAVVQIEDIIASALDLISRKGYLKTSMAEIADSVGLTKGGLYHHISTKEDILVLIHNQMADAFLDTLIKALEPKGDCKAKLKNWIGIHVKLMQDYQPHLKVFFTELDNITNEENLEHIIKKRDHGFELLYNLIKQGMENNDFRNDIHPGLVAMLIFGMLNWFYQWYRKDGDVSVQEITEEVEKLVFEGILK
jgi:AcrR family transcriptional regulator